MQDSFGATISGSPLVVETLAQVCVVVNLSMQLFISYANHLILSKKKLSDSIMQLSAETGMCVLKIKPIAIQLTKYVESSRNSVCLGRPYRYSRGPRSHTENHEKS